MPRQTAFSGGAPRARREPRAGAVDVRAARREGECVELELGHRQDGAARIRFCERLLDPFREAVRLHRELFDARCESLRGRLVRAVDREDDLEDALRRLDEPLHPRERGVVAGDREDPARRPASPALGGGLAPLGDERIRIVGEPLLRAREPRAAAQRDAVRDRLGRTARREPLLRELRNHQIVSIDWPSR